jgi:hypothetical protein
MSDKEIGLGVDGLVPQIHYRIDIKIKRHAHLG